MSEKIEVNGIKDSDVKALLEKFNILLEFNEGKIHCGSCGDVVTYENLGGFIIHNKQLLIFCNLPDCIDYSVSKYGN